MLVSLCILLLAKLERTPWLLKAANIHSPQGRPILKSAFF
jgi:hypothetical protein